MEDRVGDLLAQRAKLEKGLGAAIILSIILHASLSGLAAWAALRHGSQQPASVMTIQFAKPAAEIAPAPPAPAPVTATQAPAPPKPVAKTAPPSPFGKSKKKPAEPAAEPQQQPSKPAIQQPAIEVPIGGSGVTALEGGDFPYTIYIDRMKTLIGSHWFRPQVSSDISATMYFVVDRDGTIGDAKIETASGNGTFDRAALRAVLETSPLPPLPFGYSGTFLGVHLKFR
jgi:TonB family protein